MPNFAYQAVDASGKRQRGELTAISSGAVTKSLEERGLLVLEVVEGKGGTPTKGKSRVGGGGRRRREVLEVTRAMASLLPAGMPLAQTLNASAAVATGDVAAAVLEIRSRVERGESLSLALAEFPHLFSPMYIGLIRAGEKSGDVDAAFKRLSVQIEKDEAMRSKIVSAMVYPMILACGGTAAVLVLILVVLPNFAGLLENSGAQLPDSTAAMMWISKTMRHFWYIFVVLPIILAAVLSWVNKTPEGKRANAVLMLKIPAVNTLRRYSIAARFARIMATLIGGGAPLLTALDDTIESTIDPLAKDDAARIRQRVREGVSLSKAVSESKLYPPLLGQLIGVGEDAGELKQFLDKSAEIFEERTERATQRVATLAEPVLILFFGVIVAFVAMSLLQAIYGLNTNSFAAPGH